jgi:hypothetical protein
MDGSLTYGTKGRVISALAIVSAFVGALQASGFINLLPPDYAWIGLAVTASGLLIAGFSERLQGGASKPEVRQQAENSDQKNAREELNQ